jgi:hypothetical protein
MMRTTIVKGCLYCGLRLPNTAHFCPECGRPIERGGIPYVAQESVVDSPDTKIEGSDDLVRKHETSSDGRDPLVQETTGIRDEHVNVIALKH